MVTSDHWLCSPHSSYARFSASSLLLHRMEHAKPLQRLQLSMLVASHLLG